MEALADSFVWLAPIAATLGLIIVRMSRDVAWMRLAETAFYALFLLVAFATLRTMLVDDTPWLLHTGSLGIMTVGAVLPVASLPQSHHH